MLSNIALILLSGLIIRFIFKQIRVPSLIGLLLFGIIIGPSGFNLLGEQILENSADIRQIVLIIILTRAGLSLNLDDLKKVGRPALLLSFVPASFELIAVILLAPLILGLTFAESALLGAILAAVSPAVVVPRMVDLMEKKRGTKSGIPQLILAGSSIDDVYALVLFSSFLSMNQRGGFSFSSLLDIPLSIISAIFIGSAAGHLLSIFFDKMQLETVVDVLILLSLSLVFVSIDYLFGIVPFSGILAVLAMALIIYRQKPVRAVNISSILNQLWLPGEIFLFVLVGASVNIKYAFAAGVLPIVLILLALVVRMIGVRVSLLGTHLTSKEKLFSSIAYTPKATVQAAIGGIPLAMGLAAGELILTVSVLAILITAPLGALGMDLTYKKLLAKD